MYIYIYTYVYTEREGERLVYYIISHYRAARRKISKAPQGSERGTMGSKNPPAC